MNLRDYQIKFLMVIVLVSVFGLNLYTLNNYIKAPYKSSPKVLGDSSQVSVSAMIYGCILKIQAKPEKRVLLPNYDTHLTVELYKNNDDYIDSFLVDTDVNGKATVDLCAEGVLQPGGLYNFKIKGYSHLFMKFEDIEALKTADTEVDFTDGNTIYLLAGETSNVFDNKINSLDISTQIRNLYSYSSEKNDLNQDDKVNSLDVSNTIWNFYVEGD